MIYRGTCSCQPEWPFGSSVAGVPEPLAGWGVSYVVVPPPVEPFTVDQAKLWHRIDNDVEDSVIELLIQSARESAENYMGLSLITQTREINLPWYYEGYRLPYGPVQEVVSATEETPFLVQYIAGYPVVSGSDPTDYVGNIPKSIITGMQLLFGDLFENRENVVLGSQAPSTLPLGVMFHWNPYRIRAGFA